MPLKEKIPICRMWKFEDSFVIERIRCCFVLAVNVLTCNPSCSYNSLSRLLHEHFGYLWTFDQFDYFVLISSIKHRVEKMDNYYSFVFSIKFKLLNIPYGEVKMMNDSFCLQLRFCVS